MAVQSALAFSREVGRPLTIRRLSPSFPITPSSFPYFSHLSSEPLKPVFSLEKDEDDGDHDCFTTFWRILNLREGPA